MLPDDPRGDRCGGGRHPVNAAPACYDGSSVRSPRRRSLRAGPLSVEYGDGELRYVRLGDGEVIRRLHVAVRDPDWGTVPGRIAREEIESEADSFRIRVDVEHLAGEIDFAWRGSIDGDTDGTIRFGMDGLARTTFRRNRIGFCVLHPTRECAGARVRYRKGDGTEGESTFPRSIAPRNPFHDLQWLAYEVSPETWVELQFAGDLFEMEDQRNWIDASFKTFCTPLRIPFPVTIEAGESVVQSVTLRLDGAGQDVALWQRSPAPEIAIGGEPIGALPEIGLGTATDARSLTSRELARLRALRPSHLRVDLSLSTPAYGTLLRQATEQAQALACGLELALTVGDRADSELAELAGRIEELRPPIRRCLIFHEAEWATSPRWIGIARGRLAPGIPLVSGTTANFTELNRGRPPANLIDGVCFSAQPQEHASDNASLVETCAALRDALVTAREFSGCLPLAVTPITLRKRVNPYATDAAPSVPSDGLPPRVDVRQMSLIGAGWTLGSLKSLAEGGAASTTWFETIGWLGVMESESGAARPDLFPSRPGMVFPIYHVLADAIEWAAAHVIAATSNQPLQVEALALRADGAKRVLVANLADEPVSVSVIGLGNSARIRLLDETTFFRATEDPEAFRADPGETRATDGGRLNLALRPFAYARIETA
jgi:D-apionolactonase